MSQCRDTKPQFPVDKRKYLFSYSPLSCCDDDAIVVVLKTNVNLRDFWPRKIESNVEHLAQFVSLELKKQRRKIEVFFLFRRRLRLCLQIAFAVDATSDK